ncbi:hypothetical protein TRVA0_035S01354 [Trichomonascus vanleenenianus]|uniref:uncharacterized protein n=1 Tax=Trichomonascus vanleenenianus TaxID=2268995 RepID=UPI003ECB10C8
MPVEWISNAFLVLAFICAIPIIGLLGFDIVVFALRSVIELFRRIFHTPQGR